MTTGWHEVISGLCSRCGKTCDWLMVMGEEQLCRECVELEAAIKSYNKAWEELATLRSRNPL